MREPNRFVARLRRNSRLAQRTIDQQQSTFDVLEKNRMNMSCPTQGYGILIPMSAARSTTRNISFSSRLDAQLFAFAKR